MRLTKDQINEYKQVVLSGIDGENYGKELETDKEKIQFVMDCFQAEAYKWQKQKNIQTVFAAWLMGLPSALYIPFYNSEIIELAERINGIKYSEKQAEKIIENYFSFMTTIFFKLVKQYKIEF